MDDSTERDVLKLELSGEEEKRYQQIHWYLVKYGISPFEDEMLKLRFPQLYRSIEETREIKEP